MNTKAPVFLSAIIIVAATSPAYAYLDPGTGSMILQGLIGGIAAGATIIALYYQKVKSFFRKLRGRPDEVRTQSDDD